MNKTVLVFSIGSLFLILAAFLTVRTASGRITTQDDESDARALIGKSAPELASGDWINSPPHTLSDFRGKVVLLEFWTFGCYNCRNTIPSMNEWQKKYAGKDFVIIGVHTPEFNREKNLENVRQQVSRQGIRYPVVTDNEYQTWEAYHQQYWPTMYLIDRKGIIRLIHFGEGSYDETERTIRSLIAAQ